MHTIRVIPRLATMLAGLIALRIRLDLVWALPQLCLGYASTTHRLHLDYASPTTWLRSPARIDARRAITLPKQKLTIGPTSIQRWLPSSDCRRTVEMITMYCVDTTPVSNVVSILVTNIFSTLAVNISKILVSYFYY